MLLVRTWLDEGFDAVQACNPPDIFFVLGLVCRLAGKPFVFDQHDLTPETYESRFGRRGALFAFLSLLERCTYAAATHVIATNDTYRDTAVGRGRQRREDVTVVRNGPDTDRLRPLVPDPALREGRRHLCCYIGVMGPQDGVHLALRAAHHIVHRLGRDDVQFTFIGWGDEFANLQQLTNELELGGCVTFTGPARIPTDAVCAYLSTADLGLSPDPKNPLNDVSTMNKTMEYMAFGLPVVAFDLKETRVSARDAAVYAHPNDVESYADAIVELLDDPERRAAMGRAGFERVTSALVWQHQRGRYVALYDRLLHRHG